MVIICVCGGPPVLRITFFHFLKQSSAAGGEILSHRLSEKLAASISCPVSESSEEQIEVQTLTGGIPPDPHSQKAISLLGGAFEDLKSLLMINPDLHTCPVCFNPLGFPIYQCWNGHEFCESCYYRIVDHSSRPTCATCLVSLRTIFCPGVEEFIECMQFNCRYSLNGCTAKLRDEDKDNHEMVCSYGRCICPHINCGYAGMYDQFRAHFRSHYLCTNSFQFNSTIPIQLVWRNQKSIFFQERNERTVFVLHISCRNTKYFITLVCVAPASPVKFEFDLSAEHVHLRSFAPNIPGTIPDLVPDAEFLVVPTSRYCTLNLTILNGRE